MINGDRNNWTTREKIVSPISNSDTLRKMAEIQYVGHAILETTWFPRNSVLRSFWGRWLWIWHRIFEIQNCGPYMADNILETQRNSVKLCTRALKKKVCWINKIGVSRGATLICFQLNTTRNWINFYRLKTKTQQQNVFIELRILFTQQHMRLAPCNHQVCWLNKLFFSVRAFGVADYEFDIGFPFFEMADPKWRTPILETLQFSHNSVLRDFRGRWLQI